MYTWNKKNALNVLLYAVLYAALSACVCFAGAIHPIMFVCYQITAAILVTGVAITAFRRVRAPGVAACLALAMILLFFIIQDALPWHVVPLIVIGLLAEAVRALGKYNWWGDVAAAAIMTFSTFGYYGQIWLNRAFTYESAVEEMPAGYGDGLMAASPNWAFPVVMIVGVLVSIGISYLTAKLFKLEKQTEAQDSETTSAFPA